ncbi:MAG: hypothetical protein KF709_03565 [Gemmatimonadaceae bacterium]|nr:hypothetical protein [Gemmatimonadaceae bacterium]
MSLRVHFHRRRALRARRGMALALVLMVFMAVAAIAAGASYLGLNTTLIRAFHTRLSLMESVADAGLEQARSALNGNANLYPDTGYVVYENAVAVTDAAGNAIPGVRRTTYVGPSGITSGQYGVFGSAVSVVTDQFGNRLVRRMEVMQESFAKYAYFTDVEGNIVFGANDVLYGPVHSNDRIRIQTANPGATFWGKLKTARDIVNRNWGNYNAGYEENAPEIPFPETQDLNKLLAQATLGGTNFTSSTAGGAGQATMRIEFVALDLNADGDSTDADEGFFKVYRVANNNNAWFVVADTTGNFGSNGLRDSRNCGHTLSSGTGNHSAFKTFRHHSGNSNSSDQKPWAINNGQNRHCYLGGSDVLNDWTSPAGRFLATDSLGSWIQWTGTVDARVSAVRPQDAAYLWPLSRALNPNFKGVIHVTGKVAVSGKLRGSLTLAATGNIIIVDHLTYVTNPGGTTPCNSAERDILGLFSGNDIYMAHNLLNSPWRAGPGTTGSHRTWANRSSDEYVHAVVLALGQFGAYAYDEGPTNVEDCSGTNNERGCLYLTGGIIQYSRGPVGITDGRGYTKRYQYDACAGANPPPYFPTTGHFVRGHYYEVEPSNFNIATYWASLVPAP